MSSAAPSRASAVLSCESARTDATSRLPRSISVGILPGQTQLTVIPSNPTSYARTQLNLLTAAFEAGSWACSGALSFPPMEAMLTIRPFLRTSIAGSPEDWNILITQRAVARRLNLTKIADLAMISVGELTESSLLRRQGMISPKDLDELREAGAVGDTQGRGYGGDPSRTLCPGIDY